MAAAISDLKKWISEGKKDKATHMIVVCDTFDWADYPVYVHPAQNIHDIIKSLQNSNMQKIMEVYNLLKDVEPQLNQYRAMEF